MVRVSKRIVLKPIQEKDQVALYNLMQHIFPQEYDRFWKDGCSWYLNTFYSLDNLRKELEEKGNEYYFIRFRESETIPYKTIGILRIISDCTYPQLTEHKAYKLHRIYLDTELHGLGIGKNIMQFVEKRAKDSDHALIWLNAMDKQTQAQAFYKKLDYKQCLLQKLDFDLLHEEYKPMWFIHKLL